MITSGSNVREKRSDSLNHWFCSQLVDEQDRLWRNPGITMKSILPPKLSALVNEVILLRCSVHKRTNVFGGDDESGLIEYLRNGIDH